MEAALALKEKQSAQTNNILLVFGKNTIAIIIFF